MQAAVQADAEITLQAALDLEAVARTAPLMLHCDT